MNRFFIRLVAGIALLGFGALPQARAAHTDTFFGTPKLVNARLSPEGESIAAVRYTGGQFLVVQMAGTNSRERTLLDVAEYAGSESTVGAITWLDERYLAVQLYESRVGIGRLLDTKVDSRLLIIDTQPTEPDYYSVRTPGRLVSGEPARDGQFLYARSSFSSRVYRLSVSKLAPDRKVLGKLDPVDGGQFVSNNAVFSVDGYAIRWFMEPSRETAVAFVMNRDKALELVKVDRNGEAEVLKVWDEAGEEGEEAEANTTAEPEKRFLPIERAADPNSFFCLDKEADRNRTLYRVNFKTGESEAVYTTNAYRIAKVLVTADRELLGVGVIRDGELRYEYTNALAQTRSADEGVLRVGAGESLDANRRLVYEESFNRPGRFFLQSAEGKTLRVLGADNAVEKVLKGTRQIRGTVLVEGLEIPYLLNLPAGGEDAAHPLVVMPHGGPLDVFDTPYYDPAVGFWAANGFAVLRVNFRGSGGVSDAHREAGYGQWGRLMLEDIHRVARDVMARQDVDASRVCLMGVSYGAYAAIELARQHEQTYRCAAAVAGVYDLNLLLNDAMLSDSSRDELAKLLGVKPGATNELIDLSPAYHVQSLTTPVFLAHGGEDSRADVEHAYRLKRMLDRHGITYEWHLVEDADHGFSDPEHERILFERLLEFMQAQIRRTMPQP